MEYRDEDKYPLKQKAALFSDDLVLSAHQVILMIGDAPTLAHQSVLQSTKYLLKSRLLDL